MGTYSAAANKVVRLKSEIAHFARVGKADDEARAREHLKRNQDLLAKRAKR